MLQHVDELLVALDVDHVDKELRQDRGVGSRVGCRLGLEIGRRRGRGVAGIHVEIGAHALPELERRLGLVLEPAKVRQDQTTDGYDVERDGIVLAVVGILHLAHLDQILQILDQIVHPHEIRRAELLGLLVDDGLNLSETNLLVRLADSLRQNVDAVLEELGDARVDEILQS